ncbi:MAG: acyltransferase [Tannerella sp.]|jgi:acetyltransferase-like isoleucine patch superfamily enzyme|nr:acyltransferase [Tannerella sp.]
MKKPVKKLIKRICYSLPLVGTFLRMMQVGYVDCDFSFWNYFKFRFFCRNRLLYHPKAKNCIVRHPKNMLIGENSVIFKNGCYIQGGGKLAVGKYVIFATNIGVITANHKLTNQNKHDRGVVEIGDYCWVGMNSIILPNVVLGQRTVVGAGSVVTKSFPEGFCVIAGNPAKKIKDINPEEFVKPKAEYEFYGWIPKEKFEKFKKKHLRENTIFFPKNV